MRRKKRKVLILVFALLSFAGLLYIIVNFPPTYKLLITNHQLSITSIFFVLFFLSTFSFSAYIFNNVRRGVFVGIFLTTYLLLRFFHLTHIFFLILLIALFVTLELLFSNRR